MLTGAFWWKFGRTLLLDPRECRRLGRAPKRNSFFVRAISQELWGSFFEGRAIRSDVGSNRPERRAGLAAPLLRHRRSQRRSELCRGGERCLRSVLRHTWAKQEKKRWTSRRPSARAVRRALWSGCASAVLCPRLPIPADRQLAAAKQVHPESRQ